MPLITVPFFNVPLTKVRFDGNGSNPHAPVDELACAPGDSNSVREVFEVDIVRFESNLSTGDLFATLNSVDACLLPDKV